MATLDLASLDSMVDFYEEKGATGLTILGMMGEAGKLSAEESVTVVDRVTAARLGPRGRRRLRPRPRRDRGAGEDRDGPRARRASWSRRPAACAPTSRSPAISATWPRCSATSPGSLQDFPLVTGVQMSPAVHVCEIFADCPTCVMLKHEDWPGLEKISALRAPRPRARAASRSCAAMARSSCSRRCCAAPTGR
jgi:4-hydroxy-tetrahydrodipicolinate synthase